MKECRKCHIQKPESEFYQVNPTRLKAQCKTCCRIQSSTYHKLHPEQRRASWHRRMQNPLNRAAYNASHNYSYHLSHPNSLSRPEWIKMKGRHRKKTIEEKISTFTQRLVKNYGQPLADLFSKHPFVPFRSTPDRQPQLQKLKAQLIESLTGITPVLQATIQRVESLNKSTNLPLLNIGWHCLCCGITSNHPWFFEIDHIIPRSKGGPNHHSNKQCLCPNCHKKKTLHLDKLSIPASFKNPCNLQLRLV